MFRGIHLWRPGPGTFLVGSFFFFNTDLISLLVIGLFRFSISSWFRLGRFYVSRNLSISSRCPVCRYIIFHRSLMIPCICVVWIVTLPFSFVILFESSHFFLVNLAKGLSILFIFAKNQLLVSLIFSVVLLVWILYISTLIFVISFLLLTLGLVCSSFFIF